jgi:hypothetical protein
MSHWMFRCNDVSQKVSQSIDMTLPLHQRAAIKFHLMMCRYCARFSRQLKMLRRLSRHPDSDLPPDEPPESLSHEAKQRIKDALHAHVE